MSYIKRNLIDKNMNPFNLNVSIDDMFPTKNTFSELKKLLIPKLNNAKKGKVIIVGRVCSNRDSVLTHLHQHHVAFIEQSCTIVSFSDDKLTKKKDIMSKSLTDYERELLQPFPIVEPLAINQIADFSSVYKIEKKTKYKYYQHKFKYHK